MAISPNPTRLILLTTLISLIISLSTSVSDPEKLLTELLTLQSQSTAGIIHLNDQTVSRFIVSTKTPRPYSLLVFFDAKEHHDKAELHLAELYYEFKILATSFITNHPDNSSASYGKLFFCDIEFKDSQSSFILFGVDSLPLLRLVNPNVKNPKDSEAMDQGDLSRMAESISDFILSRAKLSVGPIHRPPPISKNQYAFLIVVLLIWIPFMIKKLSTGQTLLQDWKIWLCGAVFVYFFSVSGAMFNIIRKMPMFLGDRNDPNKLIFFYQGSGMQLGAEGFAIGFLYTVVGLLLAFMTHVLVLAKNVTVQRLVMVVSLVFSFWAVNEVIFLDNWKTGYGVHTFWPSSWN
ncbi:probable dolichyl-diphosphooligosaccharide--protein glycosyltransferase subunit 3B [Mercurialis annua]|uniref:probable dolichyl-diphosphooligosaccharide--protein glycosyltransferase subunit 3B n=1 Tax=Mercurialis annua TaxID=3986 RepID=UPI00215E3A68|nr:probable dolichyl-diphosphooligosaccharide--protein glycosyltransferase subunit 3B [Mercurialis annua]